MNELKITVNKLTEEEAREMDRKESIEKKLTGLLDYIAAYNYLPIKYPDPQPRVSHVLGFHGAKGYLTEGELLELLMILKDDGYIHLDYEGPEVKPYSIVARAKFKGKLFSDAGGYVQQLEYRNLEKKRMFDLEKESRQIRNLQTEIQTKMNRLTLILVLIGVATLTWTIWKDTHFFCFGH